MKNKNRFLVLITIIVIAVSITLTCVIANSIEKGSEFKAGNYTVISEDNGVSITGFNAEDKTIIIPAKLSNKKVVSIKAGAFNNSKIEKISFDDNIDIELPEKAFANNTVLQEIVLPKNLKNIPKSCFYGCSSLSKVSMPNSIEYIGEYAFYNCSNLGNDIEASEDTFKYYVMPTSLKEICDYAFYNCDKLDCLTVTSKLEVIGKSAFRESALQKIILAENDEKEVLCIKEIGDYAFYKSLFYSQQASEVYMPFLEKIGSYAFSSLNANFRYFRVAPSVKEIGDYAFSGCSGLQTIIFEQEENEEEITIGTNLFYSCSMLSKVELADKIKEIPGGTFRGCIRLLQLEDLVLPQGLEKIGDGAFALFDTTSTSTKYCGNVVKFKYKDVNDNITYREYNDNFKVTKLDKYYDNNNNIVNAFHFTITDYDVTKLYAYIGMYDETKYAGSPSNKIESFKFLNTSDFSTLKEIGAYAFAGAQFTKLLLPSSINSIGAYAFTGSKIYAIYFHGDSVNKTEFAIDENAFTGINKDGLSCYIADRSVALTFTKSSLYARLNELNIELQVSAIPN